MPVDSPHHSRFRISRWGQHGEHSRNEYLPSFPRQNNYTDRCASLRFSKERCPFFRPSTPLCSLLSSKHCTYYSGQPFPYTEDFFRFAIINDPSWTADQLDNYYVALAATKNPFNIETSEGDLSEFCDKG